MSARRIAAALQAKGLAAETIQFINGPSGSGWLIYLTPDAEQTLLNRGFSGEFDPDCANVTDVLVWVSSLPNALNSGCGNKEYLASHSQSNGSDKPFKTYSAHVESGKRAREGLAQFPKTESSMEAINKPEED